MQPFAPLWRIMPVQLTPSGPLALAGNLRPWRQRGGVVYNSRLCAAMSIILRHANPAYLALALAAFTILSALASEVFGGLVPCELPLTQRLPCCFGIPLLLASLIVSPALVRLALRVGALAIFFWGAYLGIHHAGAEWKLWAGPTACIGAGWDFGFDALANLNDARFVPCDQMPFRFLGLRLVGWKVLVTRPMSTFVGVCEAKT